jgi:hypothetical protein
MQYNFSMFTERDGYTGKGVCFGRHQICAPKYGPGLMETGMFVARSGELDAADDMFAKSEFLNVVLVLGKSDAQIIPQITFDWPEDTK